MSDPEAKKQTLPDNLSGTEDQFSEPRNYTAEEIRRMLGDQRDCAEITSPSLADDPSHWLIG